ncbi:hypothetical protein LEP1GSC103_3295 [Leptospira borgpetersenii serovar Javanica str. UI 09931]|uniref:Uncharacterized protein n=3 Tax=Leptospira borgpetersenii TaxID=174 RepID=M3GCP0_LEPBO|nr:hypothetical protein LBBP_02202 [Leptospira borgpetersenii serovar Ballum]EKQ90601.1 hypothetical protein LEP1GSC101_0311 [Leptospira borgpetersenii str. UI 09149]EMF98686.1 hypothetical protein LEP1GSC123_2903 [Leptospira borgpetersenii str. 200701203]EMK11214.1 hypothetical protein LEP1GSC066_2901 [Leptospira sp. serovar Kenya str. Sh9]EMN57598.1 hypothetical protein LEP1GSC090_0955 [Leptospira borgpetersenii serovar Javanica str. MK146]EMO08814.1 hypothetical protein LEP1GSC137_3397 [Lep
MLIVADSFFENLFLKSIRESEFKLRSNWFYLKSIGKL